MSRRAVLAVAAAGTAAAGLAVHVALPASPATDGLGDVLYAVLVFLLVAFAAPRARVVAVSAVALAWCVAVELLQLTGLPGAWGSVVPPLRLVLGSGFAALDLLWYAVGVALAAGADAVLRRVRVPGRRPRGARASR